MAGFEIMLAMRHLRSGSGQTLLTVSAVATGVVVVIFISRLVFGVRASISDLLTDMLTAVTVKPLEPSPVPLAKTGSPDFGLSSTRIELLWDLGSSRAVSEEERERLRARLAARLDASGMVRVVASDHRSQAQNRAAADARLAALVRQSLHVPKKRRATKPTRASKEKRLSEKKRRSERKRDRRGDLD